MLNNNIIDKIVEFGFGKYIDNIGYNVMEMPFDVYKAKIDKVGAFLLAVPGLRVITVNEYGDEIKTFEEAKNYKDDELLVIFYDPKYWEENGLI